MKKEDKIKTLERFFPHFSFRLSERYGILITFEEYIELSAMRIPNAKIRKENGKPDVYIGHLIIHGKKVKVYKSAKIRFVLLTAVPLYYEPKINKKYHGIRSSKKV